MIIADYFGHITAHELAHSAAAKYYGAEVIDFKILPSKDDEGNWHLGTMTYQYEIGTMNDNEHAMVAFTPTATNLVFLGLFVTSYELDLLPVNKYAKLSLAVIALGALVDLLHQTLDTRHSSDMTKAYDLWGYSDDQKLAARVSMGVFAGFVLVEIVRVLGEVFAPSKPEPERINYGKPYIRTRRDAIGLGWEFPF